MNNGITESIKARLLNRAKESGEEFQFVLMRYACERLLYRLGASRVRERCTLKGASLLATWMEEPYRTTLDIDLLASGGAEEVSVRAIMATICDVPCPEDGLVFDGSRLSVSPIRPTQTYPGQRVKLNGYLGTVRIPIQVDFGFGDAVIPGPEEAELKTLIGSMSAPSLRIYPRASSVSEKFEAMVQLGAKNSRMKDFHDVWALSEAFDFEGTELRAAVQGCFKRRGTEWGPETPAVLTPAFYSHADRNRQWRDYQRSKRLLTLPPQAFEAVGERVLSFLAPIRESILEDTPFDLHWPAGGPWASA